MYNTKASVNSVAREAELMEIQFKSLDVAVNYLMTLQI